MKLLTMQHAGYCYDKCSMACVHMFESLHAALFCPFTHVAPDNPRLSLLQQW